MGMSGSERVKTPNSGKVSTRSIFGSDSIRKLCAGRNEMLVSTLESALTLAVEIAREGREGRKVGTIFTIGDSDEVLARSRCLILDPLLGHPDAVKNISDPNMRETIKELSLLDGAFVVSEAGIVLSAARYLDASSKDIQIPLGLGSRHMAAASITRETEALAVVVSESSVVRLFEGGEIVTEIIPELWIIRGYQSQEPAQELLLWSSQPDDSGGTESLRIGEE